MGHLDFGFYSITAAQEEARASPHSPFISTEWQMTHTLASFRSMYSSLHFRLQHAAQKTCGQRGDSLGGAHKRERSWGVQARDCLKALDTQTQEINDQPFPIKAIATNSCPGCLSHSPGEAVLCGTHEGTLPWFCTGVVVEAVCQEWQWQSEFLPLLQPLTELTMWELMSLLVKATFKLSLHKRLLWHRLMPTGHFHLQQGNLSLLAAAAI